MCIETFSYLEGQEIILRHHLLLIFSFFYCHFLFKILIVSFAFSYCIFEKTKYVVNINTKYLSEDFTINSQLKASF